MSKPWTQQTSEQKAAQLIRTRNWKRTHRATGKLWPSAHHQRLEAAERLAMVEARREVRRLELDDERARRDQTSWLCSKCGIEPRYVSPGGHRQPYGLTCIKLAMRQKSASGMWTGPIQWLPDGDSRRSCKISDRPDPDEVRRVRTAAHKRHRYTRVAAKRGLTVIRLDMNGPCAVCGGEIKVRSHGTTGGTQHWKGLTIGHEPPLSRCRPGDTVHERPEHWSCNRWKDTRLDSELPMRRFRLPS
jgi:hypothetical protein